MKKDTKNLIIDTTIALIQKTDGDPECITNRDISKEAGIAVSQINYHFQTKENLLNQLDSIAKSNSKDKEIFEKVINDLRTINLELNDINEGVKDEWEKTNR